MKKTILVMLAVMIATPCLAHEAESDGRFTLHQTRWGHCGTTILVSIFIPPYLAIYKDCNTEETIAFHNGTVYKCYEEGEDCQTASGTYIITEYPLFSIAVSDRQSVPPNILYIFLPSGVGLYTGIWCHGIAFCGYQIGVMLKVDDNWTPPGQIMSISPNQGEQGTTLTDIQLTCIYTTFEDDGVGKILFHIPDGLTVSNIDVISNTVIEFDLEIANDAPIGERRIYVVYADGKQYLESSDVDFEVLEKTN